MKQQLKTISLDEMLDKHIGEIGTTRRDNFENRLKIELLSQAKNKKTYFGNKIALFFKKFIFFTKNILFWIQIYP